MAVRAPATRLTLSPGESGTVEILVRHGGNEVEQFTVALSGPAAAFGTVLTESVRLYPGTDAPVTVRFTPRASPAPLAGAHEYACRVASSLHPEVVRRVDGVITVRPVVDAAVEVHPEETRGRGKSFTHTVTLRNLGNAPVQSPIVVHQPGDLLRLAVEPPSVRAAPGDEGRALLRGSATRRWIGSPQVHTFDLAATLPGSTGSAVRPLRRVQKPVFPRWLLVLVLVLVAAIVVLLNRPGEKIKVLEVTGQTGAAAEQALRDSGLVVTIQPDRESKEAAGTALRTDPVAGTGVERDSGVTLFVAAPSGQVIVPAVIGLSGKEATQALTKAGLQLGAVSRRVDDTVKAGSVVASSPDAGTPVPEGFQVALVLAKGSGGASSPPTEPVVVPDLAGKTVDDAVAALRQAGLKAADRLARQSSQDVPKDSVVSSDPRAGQQVGPGSTVVLTVSSGPR